MKILLLISLLLFSFSLSAQNQKITEKSRIEEIKRNITVSCSNINNIKCNYLQKKSISLLEDDIKNEGEVIFMAPNNLYWKNHKPENQSFILKNDSVKIVNNNGENIMPIQENIIFREISKIIRLPIEEH